MNLLLLTSRYADGFFTNRFRTIFNTVDPETHIVVAPTNTNQQALADASNLVISETIGTNLAYESGVLFPFNEPQVPTRWDADQRRKIQFYIITAFSARTLTARHGLNVSAAMSSPLCWLPPRPPNQETRKVVLHYPKMRDWSDNDMAKFIMYTISAMSKDISHLSDYQIIAECAPFEYRPRNGEHIVFVDDEGAFFWQMLSAQIVVSMSHSYTMEMVFLQEVINSYGLPITLRSESMMHPAFTPETMLGKFSQPRSYTEIKTGLVTQDWYYRSASEQRHFVDVGSGIDNLPARGRITLTLDEYHKLFSRKAIRQEDWEESLVRNQGEQKTIMIEKMGKLFQRITKA